jgi:hypothetical protein
VAAGSGGPRPRQHGRVDDDLTDAVEALRREHHLRVDVDERTITLTEAVKGDPGHAVLRALGVAERVSPVGAAAYGPTGVAAGVWANPDLYLARWTKGRRWVVGYRLTGGSTPNHYVRTEGRIPTRLETGNWYTTVPDGVRQAFSAAGLSLDERPFAAVDVPGADAPPPPPPRTPPPPKAPRRASAPRTPRPPKPSRPPSPRARTEATRVCPVCRMHKASGQFVAGSDLCVDCR